MTSTVTQRIFFLTHVGGTVGPTVVVVVVVVVLKVSPGSSAAPATSLQVTVLVMSSRMLQPGP